MEKKRIGLVLTHPPKKTRAFGDCFCYPLMSRWGLWHGAKPTFSPPISCLKCGLDLAVRRRTLMKSRFRWCLLVECKLKVKKVKPLYTYNIICDCPGRVSQLVATWDILASRMIVSPDCQPIVPVITPKHLTVEAPPTEKHRRILPRPMAALFPWSHLRLALSQIWWHEDSNHMAASLPNWHNQRNIANGFTLAFLVYSIVNLTKL